MEELDVVADRGYFDSTQILECDRAGITVTLPRPQTSTARARGRFGKQDFRYVADDDVYICPAGERLTYRYTNEEKGLTLRRYWTTACRDCAIKDKCTTGDCLLSTLEKERINISHFVIRFVLCVIKFKSCFWIYM